MIYVLQMDGEGVSNDAARDPQLSVIGRTHEHAPRVTPQLVAVADLTRLWKGPSG